MKKGLIIFGAGQIADVVYYYAKNECGFNVVAFAIDREFKTADFFHGLPVENFDDLETKYPPSEYDLFIALGYQELNKLREKKYNEAIKKGYNPVSVVSPKADLPSNVSYGKNCFIMPPAIIHPCVELGNNVFVWSGAMIGHHSRIGDNCWITSSANISGIVTTGKNCFFAVNATVANNVNIGDNCFLGSGTLVTKDMKDSEVVIEPSTPVFRLNSEQFLRVTRFK